MLKRKIISKGEIIDYQTMIEEVVGPILSKSKIYKRYEDLTTEEKKEAEKVDMFKYRAYFVADADYEIILRKSVV